MQLALQHDLPLERLSLFLRRNPPEPYDVLGVVCEFYCVEPDKLIKHQTPRAVFCYAAALWSGLPFGEIAPYIGWTWLGPVNTSVEYLTRRLVYDDYLRADCSLIAVRLIERVLSRRHR
jgi:hypothetical protein